MERQLFGACEGGVEGGVPNVEGGTELGRSREGRPIQGYRFGSGPRRISLIAGCHADEPVGPRLLRRIVRVLSRIDENHSLLRKLEWWIVPQINPDGEARNRAWQSGSPTEYDLVDYLRHAVRELPGDDIEFGFPASPADLEARPENRAVYRWWRSAAGPFSLHCSLHGMAFAAGPWFLVEAMWRGRIGPLRAELEAHVAARGYHLHDVERRGEKGFERIAPGFCTRPDSRAMKRHFLDRGDPVTAERFRPSSMETIRSLGGDPLTLVSEMPLFLTPGVGRTLGPPDPVAEQWSRRVRRWRVELESRDDADRIRREAEEAGLTPMSVRRQMELQWALITSGISLVQATGPR